MGTERRSRLKGKEISSGGNSVSLDAHKLDVYILMNIVTSSCCKPIYIVIVNVKNSTNKCIVIAKLLCGDRFFLSLFSSSRSARVSDFTCTERRRPGCLASSTIQTWR